MAAIALRRSALSRRPAPSVFAVLWRRALRDARARTIGFGYLFVAVAYIQPFAYRHTYPTLLEREQFARSFANNKAVVFFYGKAYDLLTVGGYTAWRVGGTLAIVAAVFGVLAAVRALRAEEDAGRAELVLSHAVGRRALFGASMAAIVTQCVVLWLVCFAGLVAAGLPAAGSSYLALAVASVIAVFAGAGALTSQLAATKRLATELAVGFVAVSLLLRVLADTSSAGWVRWLTPLGWAEEMRPLTEARPLVLLAPLGASALLAMVSLRIAAVRDVATGALASADTAKPRLALLSSVHGHALRDQSSTLAAWAAGTCAMALVVGIVSKSVTSLGISKQLSQVLQKLGIGSSLTPKAYIGFTFSFIVLLVALFAVAQIGAARREEAEERLEGLLALPVSRREWLAGRMSLAVLGAGAVALSACLVAWAGAVSQGVSLSLPAMLEAALNCLPAAILFLGLAALAYALLPRAGVAVAYGVLAAAYLWQLFGSLLGAPKWLVEATPFAHVAAVPAVAFRAQSGAIMVALGLLACAAAVVVFERRDLTGA